jgi:hypothetical protein
MNKDGSIISRNGRGDVANSGKTTEEIIQCWK